MSLFEKCNPRPLVLAYSETETQMRHDVSLLEIDGEVKMNSLISAIDLPSSDDEALVDQLCTITGWGQRSG